MVLHTRELTFTHRLPIFVAHKIFLEWVVEILTLLPNNIQLWILDHLVVSIVVQGQFPEEKIPNSFFLKIDFLKLFGHVSRHRD